MKRKLLFIKHTHAQFILRGYLHAYCLFPEKVLLVFVHASVSTDSFLPRWVCLMSTHFSQFSAFSPRSPCFCTTHSIHYQTKWGKSAVVTHGDRAEQPPSFPWECEVGMWGKPCVPPLANASSQRWEEWTKMGAARR